MIQTNLFTGSSIKLTAPREGDENIMQNWYNDCSFTRNMDTSTARPRAPLELKNYLEEISRSKRDFHFQIRLLETDELIGCIVLDGIQWNNGCCMLAVGIGPAECRGKGYGTEAMSLVLRYAFQELNLHRVGLNFISYNTRAQGVYERLGFRYEGTVREYVHRDGDFYDLVYMGMLQEEWLAMQHGNENPPDRI